jgi:hypothetical protein
VANTSTGGWATCQGVPRVGQLAVGCGARSELCPPRAPASEASDARPGRACGDGYGVLLCPVPGLLFLVPATVETYLATDWIWALDSELPKAGIPPPPLVT